MSSSFSETQLQPEDTLEDRGTDDRLEQEEPDPVAAIDHTAQAQADEIVGADDLADEVGIDGGAASAEESAVHTVDEDGV